MKLGVIEGKDYYFHIETKDAVKLNFNKNTGAHEIIIGPFTEEQYKLYVGQEAAKKEIDNQTGYISDRTEFVNETPFTQTQVMIEPSTQKPMSDLVAREDNSRRTTAPIIDWGTDTDFTPAAPTNPAMVEKAKAAIAKIDTTEAEKELEAMAKAPAKPNAPFVAKSLAELEAKARESIVELDKQLAEGGRVNVADKFLLNCQADLNQLVPFKYGWVWGLYLKACEEHWMPPEFNLEKTAIAFKDGTLKPSQKAMITKAWYTEQYQQLLLPIQSVLNCYRLITNPECRQYTLRQAFELSLKKHAWLHLTESLIEEPTFAAHVIDKQGTKSSASLALVNDTFKERYTLIKDNLVNISGETFTTEGIDNIRTFVYELIVGFGYVNYIMLLPAYYQVMNLTRLGLPTEGVSNLFEMMVKDIRAQSTYLRKLVSGIIDENPEVMNEDFNSKVIAFFKKALSLESDIVSLYATCDSDFASIEHLLHYEVSGLLGEFNITFPTKQLPANPDHHWFLKILSHHTPPIQNVTNTSGTGTSAASLGEWE